MLRQDTAAGVGIVMRKRVTNVGDGEVVVVEFLRIDAGLILLYVAAGGVDLSNAGDRTQQGTYDPVLHGAALDELLLRERTLAVAGQLQRVLIDLAQRVGDWSKHRSDSLRHAVSQLGEPLRDHLALQVQVAAILKDQRNQR